MSLSLCEVLNKSILMSMYSIYQYKSHHSLLSIKTYISAARLVNVQNKRNLEPPSPDLAKTKETLLRMCQKYEIQNQILMKISLTLELALNIKPR